MLENRCIGCMKKWDGEAAVCPHCGFDMGRYVRPENALPPGSLLANGKYLVGRVLGQGGFGITYIALDKTLDLRVAIKEYMPQNMAYRTGESASLHWNSSIKDRQAGRNSFVREARKMAKIDQIPGVVRVREVFFENDTAYIVMDFIEGETLMRRLREIGTMDAKSCFQLLTPIMKSLEAAHQRGMIHRDISPDNIMLDNQDRLWLLDMGAAKEIELNAASDNPNKPGNSTTMVVRHGFSPLEQYTSGGNIGAWTDVYAMSATFFYCMSGKVPPLATDRVMTTRPLDIPDSIPPEVAEVLKRGLALFPEERIQNMAELRGQLESAVNGRKSPGEISPKIDTSDIRPAARPKWAIPGAIAAALLAIALIAGVAANHSKPVNTLSGAERTPVSQGASVSMPSNEDEGPAPADSEAESGAEETIPKETVGERVSANVLNNGGYFVQVDDRVYFRRYGSNALEKTALWGYFLDAPTGGNSELCYYDNRTGKVGTLCSDNGYGKLYYSPAREGFYENVMNGSSCSLYFLPLKGGERELIDDNYEICGISEDGIHLAIYDSQDGTQNMGILSLYSDGTIDGYIIGQEENDTTTICGIHENQLIFLSHNLESGEEKIWQFDEDYPDSSICLGTLPASEDTYEGEVQQFLVNGSTMHCIVAWYEGTGHYLSHFVCAEATLYQEDSLKIYATSWGENDFPSKVYLADNGNASFSNQTPGDLKLSDELYGDLLYYETSKNYLTMIQNFIPESQDPYGEEPLGYSRMILDMEAIGDAAYLMVADTRYNPDEDIGWRMAFDMLNLYYLRVPIQEDSYTLDLFPN